jgi:hypothetical protein
MTTPAELLEKVRRVWSRIDAPAAHDMRALRWESGDEAAKAFTGVKPVDVDIQSPGFRMATPLLELPARATAAYMGTYMISLLFGLIVQENVGFPTDITTRAHTLSIMMAPNFWTDIAGPHLPPECLDVVGDVAALVISRRDELTLTDKDVARFEKLIRSVRRALTS